MFLLLLSLVIALGMKSNNSLFSSADGSSMLRYFSTKPVESPRNWSPGQMVTAGN